MNGLKRAENLAWAALGALVVVGAILLTGGIIYKFTGFWAGALLALAQAVAVALAAWGLMLARQAAELGEPGLTARKAAGAGAGGAGEGPASTFRMSMGDDAPAAAAKPADASDVRTLDIGFQRLVVGLAGGLLAGLGALAALLVYWVYRWSSLHPDLPVPVAGTYDAPVTGLDELGLVIGVGAAAIYGVFWWLTRVRRTTEGYGEAVSSGFTLGVLGMSALAAASVLGYFKVSFASELAAGVIAAMMILQGLELLVNSMRTYSSIEEFDQEAVDLQAQPLVPMLGSVWLGGLKMLFAQSMGLSGKEQREAGVFARMMPRALLAMVIIAIGVSCIRVVPPGEVAILERLGYAPVDPDTNRVKEEAILEPGMHLTLPWPIDELVSVPRDRLQLTDVGKELHAPDAWKNVDFQFWMIRAPKDPKDEEEDEFLTGDPGRAMLETYVQVRWRVKDPALFYNALSHSEFYEKKSDQTRVVPIYEAIVQQCTSFAVTRAFAIHAMDDIMINNRIEVEKHCKKILQEKLDLLNSGIEAVVVTIKDLHPPYWRADIDDPTADEIAGQRRRRGPASAFEFVVTAQQYRDMVVREAEAQRDSKIALARGDAAATVANARAFMANRVSTALGEAGRLGAMLQSIPPEQREFQIDLMKRQLTYKAMREVYDPVSKIIVDPRVGKDIQIFQTTENGLVPIRPPQQ
jgi:regulator of protease activity HflC (stomatin/prohibitin superfamily)